MEEKKIIISLVLLAIGVLVLTAGMYYLIKEREDQEARKIYRITQLVGAVLILGIVIKLLIAGF